MGHQRIFLLLFVFTWVAFIFAPPGSALDQESAEELYEAARFKKEAEGDLQGAIELFHKIVTAFSENRKLAAQAQLQIGICYEKLGREEAQKAYQKVVDNFPDQTDEAKLARDKLSALQRAQAPVEDDKQFRIRKVFPFGIFGTPSLDGRLVSCRDDSGDLAIIEIDTEKRRRLTKEASWANGDFVSKSIISPDAKKVVYCWSRGYSNYDLRIINIDGTGQRILYSGRYSPMKAADYIWPCDWTPDGKNILGLYTKQDGKNQIAYVSALDGSLRVVKQFDDISPEVLDLSPDGRWIAYGSPQNDNSEKHDIIILNADGSQEMALVRHPADDRLMGWTPSGKWILFGSDRAGTWDAWIVPLDKGKACGDAILIKRDFGRIGASTGVKPLGFTQSGSFYYRAQSWMEDVHIAAFDMEKAELLIPPRKVAQRFEGTNCYPDWSPDGKYLAFISRRTREGTRSGALCLFSTETGEQRDVIPDLIGAFGRLNWLPDGESVLVVGRGKDGRGGIYRVNVNSGKVIPIVTEGENFHSPRCTPDGKYVFYEVDSWGDKVFRIMKHNLENGESQEFYRSSFQIIRMDISPDGNLLAFFEMADSTLKVISTEGGQARVLFKFEEGWSTSVAWSPDGKYLFFSKIPKGSGKTDSIELWRVPREGGNPVKYPLVADGMENLTFHPDGRQIAFNSFKVDYEVYVMENFLPQKKHP